MNDTEIVAVFTLLGAAVGGLIVGIITYLTTTMQIASSEKQLEVQLAASAAEQEKQRLFDAKAKAYVDSLGHFVRTIRNIEHEFNGDFFAYSSDKLKEIHKQDSDATIDAINPIMIFGQEPLNSKVREFATFVRLSQHIPDNSQRKQHIKNMLNNVKEIVEEMKKELGIR